MKKLISFLVVLLLIPGLFGCGGKEETPGETVWTGSFGYMPTDICFDYIDCYEVRASRFNRGDAERIIDVYVDLLNKIRN